MNTLNRKDKGMKKYFTIERKSFSFTLKKLHKDEWSFKPSHYCALDNYHRIINGKGFKYINTWSYYIPTTINLCWLIFKLQIKIKPKLLSGKIPIRYVKYENTHLELMDLPQGNWDDKSNKQQQS